MLEYELFGKKIVFDPAAERYFDLMYAGMSAVGEAMDRFEDWYQQCGDIQSVLRGYSQEAEDLVADLAVRPLYKDLVQSEIYDIGKETYQETCVDLCESEQALKYITSQYNAIEQQRQAQIEYRAARKDARGRWQGGGFGFGGTIKGAAMAGSMNAVITLTFLFFSF